MRYRCRRCGSGRSSTACPEPAAIDGADTIRASSVATTTAPTRWHCATQLHDPDDHGLAVDVGQRACSGSRVEP